MPLAPFGTPTLTYKLQRHPRRTPRTLNTVPHAGVKTGVKNGHTVRGSLAGQLQSTPYPGMRTLSRWTPLRSA
jgi:hypothetical protein